MNRPRLGARAAVAAAVLLWAGATDAPAGGGPENVALVVNADSWASLTVANEYVRLRGIPPRNVVSLALGDLVNFETVDVDTFRARMLTPVLKALEARGLAGQVDCIAYSSDIPYAVNARGDLGKRKAARGRSPTASVTGLTFLYQLVLAKDARYLSLGANFYYRPPGRAGRSRRPWTADEHARLSRITKLLRAAKWAQAQEALAALIEAHPEAPALHYNLACCLSELGRLDEAMAALNRAVRAGWTDKAHTEADKNLRLLRDRDDFKKLLTSLAKAKRASISAPPSTAFRNRYAWGPGGDRMPAKKGLHYFLSTMLAVTSGRGNSVGEAVACLRRAAGADARRPKGTVYLMANSNIRSRTRAWAFEPTAAALKELGVSAEIVNGTLPRGKDDVAGLVAGCASFNWPRSKSTILPGAVCEHLTSFGGVMHQRGGQTPISEFIRYGAAGTSGTVTEPMAIQAKFPTPFLHVHYARGCSLAEAFYLSVAGPYQLLILGDPICRPWARVPRVRLDGVRADETVKGTLKMKPKAAVEGGAPIGRFELFVDGRRVSACRPGATWALHTTDLADGWHELRAVAVVDDSLETQGSARVPIRVDNRGSKAAASCAAKRIRWGQTAVIEAAVPGAARIELSHLGRTLHTAAGDKAKMTIDSRALGMGPAVLYPAAVVEAEGGKAKRVRCRPIHVTVDRPKPMRALRIADAAKFAPGLKVSPAGGAAAVVKDLRDVYALEKAGVKKDQAYVLRAHFDVPADGLYQFQVHASGKVALKVDAAAMAPSPGGRWRFVPVSLAKGTHRFVLACQAKGRARLDLRFGRRGARSPNEKTFRHVTTGP